MCALEKPKATILVIDDEQIVHESVRRILEAEGYRVDGALRVKEALDKLAVGTYDLVLTDLMMPDDSGMRAVEAVAKDHPYCGVVMFTGYATVESAVESMKLGALDYLPKPFTPDELVDMIQKALEKTYKARRDRELEDTFSEAEKAMRSSLDLREILNLICASVVRLLQVKGSVLCMYMPKEKALEIVSSRGLPQDFLDKGALDPSEGLQELLRTGETSFITDQEFKARLQFPDEAKKEGIVAIWSVPLKVKDTILGVLRLFSADKKSLTDDENEILMKFIEQAARAIEHAMSFEQLRSDIESLKGRMPGRPADKEAV